MVSLFSFVVGCVAGYALARWRSNREMKHVLSAIANGWGEPDTAGNVGWHLHKPRRHTT